jgi:hypothetical protein
MSTRHPAPYSPSILERIDELTSDGIIALDPFAGPGERLGELAAAKRWHLVCIEIETGWASQVQADATALPFRACVFDLAVTSVTYANGLADKGLNMANPRGRRTYDLFLGRPLHLNNTGQYGLRQGTYQDYLHLHRWAFTEVHRVLKNTGRFILNCSDVIHSGKVVSVVEDNVRVAERVGFRCVERYEIETPRYRNGANANARAAFEQLVVLERLDRPMPKVIQGRRRL